MNNLPSFTGHKIDTKVIVETVYPLTSDELLQLSSALKAKLGPVSIENKHNPLLLGGLKLTVKGKVIDLSLSTRLKEVQRSLLAYAKN